MAGPFDFIHPKNLISTGNLIFTSNAIYTNNAGDTAPWPTITTASSCSDNTVYWIGYDTAGGLVPSRSVVMTNVGALHRVAIEMAQAMRQQQVAFDQQALGAGLGVQQAGYAQEYQQQCLSNQFQGLWPTQQQIRYPTGQQTAMRQQQTNWAQPAEHIAAITATEELLRIEREARERRAKAEFVAEKLLLSALTDEQQEQYRRSKYFEVTSKTSRRRYRISYGWAGNVFVFDEKGRNVEKLCIHPSVQVPVPDHLLAQKFMLESDEEGFRRTANITRLAA